MELDDELRLLIADEASAPVIRRKALELGMQHAPAGWYPQGYQRRDEHRRMHEGSLRYRGSIYMSMQHPPRGPQPPKRRRLERLLIENGLLTEQQLSRCARNPENV